MSHSRKNLNHHQNDGSSESSEETFFNQCESCCYDIQQTTTNPYKCAYNNILYQYKERLKKAQIELTEKELMIAMLKDQNTKMENYCRCSIEDSRNIKVKYYQLLEEMENFRKDNEVQRNKSTNENNESLEAYLRSEVDVWKEDSGSTGKLASEEEPHSPSCRNKEILDKIELMDFDIQKVMHFVSNATRAGSDEDDVRVRMDRLEDAIKKQSEILALLHTKVVNKTVFDQAVEAKMNDAEYSLGDLEVPGSSSALDSQAEGRTKNTLRAPFDETPDLARAPSVRKTSALVLNPEDDVLISIQIQGAMKSKKSENGSDPSLMERSHATSTTTTETELRSILDNASFRDEVTSTTDTELIRDFLEIASKEERYFDGRGPVWSQASDLSGYSEKPSGISALTPSECEKIFREIPSESPTKPPKPTWSNYETFNEFEHYQSSMLAGRDSPITPVSTNEEKEEYKPAATKNCCVIPDDDTSRENELQMVLFQKNAPPCCKASGDTLKIEEISSVSEKNVSTDPPTPAPAGEFQKEYASIVEDDIPKMFPDANLDETSSLPSTKKYKPTGSPEDGVIQEEPIQPTKGVFVESFSKKGERTKPEAGTSPGAKRPECCKIPAVNSLREEPTNALEEPPNKEESNDIPIIYDSEEERKTVDEEEIQKRFVAPYFEEQQKQSLEDANSPRKNTLLLFEDLQSLVDNLRNIIAAAKEESSTLRTLREDFKTKHYEWEQDVTRIKTNTDKTNENLNELREDVISLKIDIKDLLHKQEQQNKHEDHNEEEERKITDSKKVLERVKNLEQSICKCGTGIVKDKNKKICSPSAGCKCKYKKKDGFGRSDDETNTNDRKISFTVQSCVLNTMNSFMGAPYIVRLGNRMASLTYENNQKSNEEENKKEKRIEELPDI